MTTSQLKEILKSNILIMATADQTNLSILEEYVQAGANLLLAPAFGRFNEEDEAVLETFFGAAEDCAFVAGQIEAPDMEFADDEAFDAYYESVVRQAAYLDKMEVSMIFLTNVRDAVSAKCAWYAIREATSLPVCVGICVGEDDDSIRRAVSLLITLQALDVCAVGCTGMYIDDALSVLSELQAFATVPLFAMSNPGAFLTPEEYSDYLPSFVHQKSAMLGLTSGSPAFVAAASKGVWQYSPLRPDFPTINAVCSANEIMFLDFSGKIVGKNKQLLEIKTEKEDELKQAMALFNQPGTTPVCFNIKDIDLLEYAILHYNGRPAVKSDEYGEITAKELGAMVLESEPEKKN